MRISHNEINGKRQFVLRMSPAEYESIKSAGLDGPIAITWDPTTKRINIAPSPDGGPIIRFHARDNEYRVFQSRFDADANQAIEPFGITEIPEQKTNFGGNVCTISLENVEFKPLRTGEFAPRNRTNVAPSNPPRVNRKKIKTMETESKPKVETIPEIEAIELIEPDLSRQIATVRVTSAIIEAVNRINELKKRFGGGISLEIDKNGMLNALTMLRIGPEETD